VISRAYAKLDKGCSPLGQKKGIVYTVLTTHLGELKLQAVAWIAFTFSEIQPIRGLRDTVVNPLALASLESTLRNTMFCVLATESNTRMIDHRQRENGASQPAVYVQKSACGST
jgi:hypothetical protein